MVKYNRKIIIILLKKNDDENVDEADARIIDNWWSTDDLSGGCFKEIKRNIKRPELDYLFRESMQNVHYAHWNQTLIKGIIGYWNAYEINSREIGRWRHYERFE